MTSPHVNTNVRVDKNFEIKLTKFQDVFARHKEDKTASLTIIANAVRKTKGARKEDLQLLKLATFGDMHSPKGSLRWDNNVLSVSGVELDYDGEKISFDDARLLLLEADVACIIYTTPSHTEEKPRWRVLAPFSCKMVPAERMKMIARLNGIMNGVANPESFSLSQAYYYGYITEQPRVDIIEGTPINLRDDLDAGAIGKHGKSTGANGHNTARTYTDMEELIRRIVSGESLHPSVLSIAGKMAARGDSRETCIEVVGGAFEAAKADRYTDARWQGDVLRAIDYVYQKEEEKRAAFPAAATQEDFYYDLERGDYIYTPLMTHWPAKSINAHLPKNNGVKQARWLAENRPVHQRVWAPGFPQIIKDKHLLDGGEWLGKDGVVSINSYVPPTIRPGNPRGAARWINLVTKLYPVEKEHTHLIDTLAYKLQHPEVKINHMIIIGGSKRIGKDSILEPFKRGIGYRNVAVVSPNMIMSDFNRYAQSLLLHISETRDLGEIKKTIFAEKLKGLVAVPPYVIAINEKHKAIYTVLNACLVIATTNHRTDSLYVTEDDGRYFPVWSDIVKENFEPLFFLEFHEWLDSGGTEDVLAYLRARDVSAYRPKMLPPVTDLFLEMVDQSRPVEFEWVAEAIAAMATTKDKKPPAILTIDALAGKLTDFKAKEFFADRSKRKFLVFILEQHGYVKVPHPKAKDKCWQTGDGRKTYYGLRILPPNERERLVRETTSKWDDGN